MSNKRPDAPLDGTENKGSVNPSGRERPHAQSLHKNDPINTFIQLCRNINDLKQQDQLLDTIAKLIPKVIQTGCGAVLLWDKKGNELVAKAVGFHNAADAAQFNTERVPLGKGVGSRVFKTGSPLIVNDYVNSPHRCRPPEHPSSDWICSRMDVPLKIHGRTVGVISAINKNKGDFDQSDVDLLASVSGITALAMENIRIRESLAGYYRQMKNFNRARDRVIHQLSHALKTPLAVLMASLKLLHKYLDQSPDTSWHGIYERVQRNLARLLTIEYEMEDILRQRQDNENETTSLTMSSGNSSTVRSDENRDNSGESDQNGREI